MMYCFFVASLPTLCFGEVPQWEVARFDAEAESALSAADFRRLKLWDDPETPEAELPEIYRAMRRFDAFLAWRIAAVRAEKLGKTAEFPLPDEFFGEVDFTMPQALAAANPADRETLIDRLRWQKLDDLTLGHDFDFASCCIYRLRLLLLEKLLRRAAGNGSDGFEKAALRLAENVTSSSSQENI